MNEQTPNQFIENFQKELETTQNKDYLIENELEQIKAYTTNREDRLNISNSSMNKDNRTNSVFDLSYFGDKNYIIDVFHEFLINGSTDNSRVDHFSKSHHQTAILFAKYYMWLKELQAKPIKANNKNIIPHKQKMLILYYLELNITGHDKTKLAELLSKVLELDKDNTRKYLSYVANGKNEVRTLKNLKTVKTIFDSCGLTEISNQIQKDIESMK